MKTVARTVLLVMLCGILYGIRAQHSTDSVKYVEDLLRTRKEFDDYQKRGFTSRFTGQLRETPPAIAAKRSRLLPSYEVYIAKMDVLIDPPVSRHDLIVLVKKDEPRKVGLVWANYWTLPPSRSFSKILKGYRARDERNALEIIGLIGELVTALNGDTVGKASVRRGQITLELRRGDGIRALLVASVDKNFVFDSLAITEATGREIGTFVSAR